MIEIWEGKLDAASEDTKCVRTVANKGEALEWIANQIRVRVAVDISNAVHRQSVSGGTLKDHLNDMASEWLASDSNITLENIVVMLVTGVVHASDLDAWLEENRDTGRQTINYFGRTFFELRPGSDVEA